MLIPSDWNGFTWQFNGFYTLNGHNLSFINLGCNPSKLGWSVGVLEYWSIGNNSKAERAGGGSFRAQNCYRFASGKINGKLSLLRAVLGKSPSIPLCKRGKNSWCPDLLRCCDKWRIKHVKCTLIESSLDQELSVVRFGLSDGELPNYYSPMVRLLISIFFVLYECS